LLAALPTADFAECALTRAQGAPKTPPHPLAAAIVLMISHLMPDLLP
jgi:hypothetical protein